MSDLSSILPTARSTPESGGRPPLRPSWLPPLLATIVVSTHVIFFASGVYWPAPQYADLGRIDAELVPEGDSLEAGDPAPEGDNLDVEAKAAPEIDDREEELEVAAPPVMTPDAVPAPPKKRAAEKAAKPERKPKKAADEKAGPKEGKRYGLPGGTGKGLGTARVGGRFGLPSGRGPAGGASQATCLAQVAASVRRHLPGATSLGPGTAFVTFYVNPGGGISGISVSASSPAHGALARRIVASSRGPGSCGSAYASQSLTFE